MFSLKQKSGILKNVLLLLLAAAISLPAQGNPLLVKAASMELTESQRKSADAQEAANPANPVHHCTGRNGGSDNTDWDYIYFGSYPQTEVTGAALTAAITGASYDADGDAWIGGIKYRRIQKKDTNYDIYFGDSVYRYFKWERIRWRVLQNTGSSLLLLADKGLDCRDYHAPGGSVTWETSIIRSWLNTEFYHTAFTDLEQGSIEKQTISNEDNPVYGTEGGNDTEDHIVLLSMDDAANLDYGFCDNYGVASASRWIQPSDYAHVLGAYAHASSDTGGNANCSWWLRSPGWQQQPGSRAENALYVSYGGSIDVVGAAVSGNHIAACVPALQLHLASELWLSADDGTSGYGGNASSPVLSPLKDQQTIAGTAVTFSITASGGIPSAYTYQWYSAQTAQGAGTPIAGETASVYTITPDKVTASLNGSYIYCVVSNGIFETTSSRAKLTISASGNPSDSPAEFSAPKLKVRLSAANAVKLSWNKVAGASSYIIYRAASPKGTFKKIKMVKKTTFTNKKLKKGTTYYYKVEARNGNRKALSKAVSKKIIGKPSAPKLKLTASGGRFTLSWGRIKQADKVEIYMQADNGRWKKWKTLSAKKKKFSYSYNNINWNQRCAFKVRGYYRKDGITVYGNYSNAPALARQN